MKYLYLLFISFVLFACSNTNESYLKYRANSDAIAQFHKGWVQIMDEGRYKEAVVFYRKAVEYDADFLIGKNVLA
mgnify:CR=1 FL=1